MRLTQHWGRASVYMFTANRKGINVRKTAAVMLFVACQIVYADDDLVNCRWENGESMSESTCNDQRELQQEKNGVFVDKPIPLKQRNLSLTKNEKAMISNAVKLKLKDPDAAKFKWVKLAEKSWYVHYCGMVNSKNSYGGYVGFQPFVAVLTWTKGKLDSNIKIDIDDPESAIEFCEKIGYTDLLTAKD